MYKEVTLSDSEPCRVRVLGLFELDGVGSDIPGPYKYEVLTYTGRVYQVEYTPPDEPLTEPEDKQPEPRSQAWHDLNEWETHQAYLAHEAGRAEAIERWLENAARHILEDCLEADDALRLVEPEDYVTVYRAATVPRLTKEHIAEALKRTFRASFQGLDILDALWRTEPGEARLDAVRLWEAQFLNQAGLVSPEQEAEYGQLSIMERARRVAAFKLSDWIAALEIDRMRKEA